MQNCVRCDEFKNLLDEKGIRYNHLDMTEMPNNPSDIYIYIYIYKHTHSIYTLKIQYIQTLCKGF
jgi:hypothetical protein